MRPSEEKRALRKTLRMRRLALGQAAAADADARIVERLWPLCEGRERVALFWPMLERREIDLRPLDTALRSSGTELYYPWLPSAGEHGPAAFRLLEGPEGLARHALGFYQPSREAPLAGEIDWMVVPALAATRQGQRLGYGAGTYDRLLAAYHPAETVVVVRANEVLESLPLEPHDRSVHWVVSDEETIGRLG